MKKILYTIIAIAILLLGCYFVTSRNHVEVPILMYHHFDTDEKNINDVTVKNQNLKSK